MNDEAAKTHVILDPNKIEETELEESVDLVLNEWKDNILNSDAREISIQMNTRFADGTVSSDVFSISKDSDSEDGLISVEAIGVSRALADRPSAVELYDRLSNGHNFDGFDVFEIAFSTKYEE